MATTYMRPINPTMAQLALAKFGLQALQSGNQDPALPALTGNSAAPQQQSTQQPAQSLPSQNKPSSGDVAQSMLGQVAQSYINQQSKNNWADWKPGTMQANTSSAPDAGFSTTPMPEMGPTVQAAAVQQTNQPGYFDNAGNYVQGAAGALQAKAGYDQWQQGNKVAGGMNMAAGATNVASAAGSSTAGSAAPYLNTALGAYNVGNTLFGDNNMTGEEKATRAQQQAALMAADYFTFGLATPAEGLIRKAFGKEAGKLDKLDQKYNPVTRVMKGYLGGKDRDQMNRDAARKAMQQGGFLDDQFNVQLAGGNKFDLGQDGSKQIYNTDPNNPAAAETIADVHLLAAMIGGPDQKIKSDVAGMLTNAALSNGDPVSNVIQMYQNFGITNGDEARSYINEMQKSGVITKEDGDQMQQNVAKMFGMPSAKPAAGTPKKTSSGGKKVESKKKASSGGKQKPALFPAKPQVDFKPGSTAQFSMTDYINSINRMRAGN